ncbi:MAG TPA: methyltransferase [Mycobacteriales bacterium]|jgi:16S rRNA G1207 methylase RsmC|nr:methyltransferase [Mycobacteriales bacterium]
MGEHYFTRTPAGPETGRTVAFPLDGVTRVLHASSGVFSQDRLDPGTEVLLRHAPRPPAEGTLLDLGCGYGPIACALAIRSPAATVWAIDVNERALRCTAANAERLGLPRVRAAFPEDVPDGVTFAAIYGNPPIRIGKAALHDLLLRWLARLAPGGAAYLVVHRNLGSDSLQRWLLGEGFACERLHSENGYRVLRVAAA